MPSNPADKTRGSDLPPENAGSPGGEGVAAEIENHILWLTIDNPPANALSIRVMTALLERLRMAAADPEVRVVILAAKGKLFSGGHDLKEMTLHRNDGDSGRAFFERTFALCSTLMQEIAAHPKPVIAAVDGIATAAGCQLVASCDLAIASKEARFGVNGIDVGLFCSTPAVAISRVVKPKHAMEMLMTGALIDAPTARQIGLLNRVVDRVELNQFVREYAQAIAEKSPLALKVGKQAFRAQAGLDLAAAYGCASKAMVENMLADDAEEGIAAFMEKRRPQWTGR